MDQYERETERGRETNKGDGARGEGIWVQIAQEITQDHTILLKKSTYTLATNK